jgi:hypothetical protein
MAVAVTLVLWLPDVYVLALGQPPRAVAVLFAMHLAIAVVTYNCLVHFARTRPNAAYLISHRVTTGHVEHSARENSRRSRGVSAAWRYCVSPGCP